MINASLLIALNCIGRKNILNAGALAAVGFVTAVGVIRYAHKICLIQLLILLHIGYITGIITEKGILRPPYSVSIPAAFNR